MQTHAEERAAAAYRNLKSRTGDDVECWCGDGPAGMVTGKVPGLKVMHRRDLPRDEVWFVQSYMGITAAIIAKYKLTQ